MFFSLRRKVKHDFYEHTTSELPQPGAGSMGFVPAFPNPPVDLIGAATMSKGSINPYQPHQVFANLAVPNVGVGGTETQASIYFTPLVANDVSQVM